MTATTDLFETLLDRPTWHDRAACRGIPTEVFFRPRGPARDDTGHFAGSSLDEARAICAGCPVRPECLGSAIAHHERFGIWAGQPATSLRPGRLPETIAALVEAGCAECGEVA